MKPSPQKRAKSLLDTVIPSFHNGDLVETRGTTIPIAAPTELSFFLSWLHFITIYVYKETLDLVYLACLIYLCVYMLLDPEQKPYVYQNDSDT